jgi:hypothetical protein
MIMDRSKLKSVGFSIMRQPGDFKIELDLIEAVNLPGTLGDIEIMDDDQYYDQYGSLKKLSTTRKLPLFPKDDSERPEYGPTTKKDLKEH